MKQDQKWDAPFCVKKVLLLFFFHSGFKSLSQNLCHKDLMPPKCALNQRFVSLQIFQCQVFFFLNEFVENALHKCQTQFNA